jgi:hypothetical protein
MSDLSNDAKKHTTKSRETIPLKAYTSFLLKKGVGRVNYNFKIFLILSLSGVMIKTVKCDDVARRGEVMRFYGTLC